MPARANADHEEDEASESEDAANADAGRPGGRGRPKIPIAWTRVMKVRPDIQVRVQIHTIDTEIARNTA